MLYYRQSSNYNIKKNNMDKIIKNDLYWEHQQHFDLIPEQCSECFKEEQDLTLDKRMEEAEQADRAELEDNEEDHE